MNKTVGVLLLLAAALANAAEVYRWRDANGVWHFSDKPQAGSEKIEVKPAPSVKMAPAPSAPAAERATTTAPAIVPTLTILAPAPEATIHSAAGEVDVAVGIEPGLVRGYQLRILLDGQVVAGPGSLTQVSLTGLDRGAHTVGAELIDASGQVVAQAEPHTFYLHKPSIYHPAHPANPANQQNPAKPSKSGK